MANIEELAVAALHAWNGVPGGHFTWPQDFPEGSRAAWRRVVTAILEQYAAANPGRSLDELTHLHQPDRFQDGEAFKDKREPRNSPAAPRCWICGGCEAALTYEEVQTHQCPASAAAE